MKAKREAKQQGPLAHHADEALPSVSRFLRLEKGAVV